MWFNILFYGFIYLVSAILVKKLYSFSRKKTKFNLPPSPIGLPIIGHLHLAGTIPHQSFHKLCARYGPMISLRFGSVPIVVVCQADIAKEFLISNENNFATRPVTSIIKYLSYDCNGFAFSPYGPYWKYMKKVCMAELLGHKAVLQLEPLRREELHQFVKMLLNKAKTRESITVSEELMKLSNNIISRSMLSVRYSEKNNEATEAITLMREMSEIFLEFKVGDFIPMFKNIDFQGIGKRAIDIRRRFDAVLEGIMNKREEIRKIEKLNKDGGVDRVKDFLDVLLDSLEDENAELKITTQNIKAFVMDVFIAGTDSEIIPIEWALAELINHPDMLEKARNEINSVVGTGRLTEEADTAQLPYIQAVMRETLRLHPPAPMFLREAKEDCKIRGYDIPAKTRLFFNIWSINRDPNNWENPLQFTPDRFMKHGKDDAPTSLIDVNGRSFHFPPFGTGRRACPGMWMALTSMPAILGSIIQCFDWELLDPKKGTKITSLDMAEQHGLTVPRAHPLLLIPITRFDPFATNN